MSAGFCLSCFGPDGDFGSETQKYVKQFQRMHGIPATGVIDNQTWELLIQYDTYK